MRIFWKASELMPSMPVEGAGGPVAGGMTPASLMSLTEDRRALFVGPEVVLGEDVLGVDAVHVVEERLGVADGRREPVPRTAMALRFLEPMRAP